VLCIDDVYGGTHRYFSKVLSPASGIKITYAEFSTAKEMEKHMNKNTKLIWLETPTNPTLKVFDIEMVSKVAKKHGAIFVVDNTFMTPYFQ
jgi:cystathionine beta-lyase/cystathionine gamma-synthase